MANKKSLTGIIADAFKGCKETVRACNCEDNCNNCSVLNEACILIEKHILSMLEKHAARDWEAFLEYL